MENHENVDDNNNSAKHDDYAKVTITVTRLVVRGYVNIHRE